MTPKKRPAQRDYQKFARHKRNGVGRCELGTPVCTGQPDSIHHVIKRSQGGALHPGQRAVAQGQVFMVSCIPCNAYVEDNPAEARRMGLVKSNPLRGRLKHG